MRPSLKTRFPAATAKHRCPISTVYTRVLATLLVLAAVSTVNAQSFRGLGPPPDPYVSSGARGVSADGTIVAGFVSDAVGGYRALRWNAGTFTILDDLGGPDKARGEAWGISGDGSTIIGRGNLNSGPARDRAVKWVGTSPIELEVVGGERRTTDAYAVSADGSAVVGIQLNDGPIEACRWQGGVTMLGMLPNGVSSYAMGVSADGSIVVGMARHSNGDAEAFRWDGGAIQGLGDLEGGSRNSGAQGISADGKVIVGYGTSRIAPVPVRWVNGVIESLTGSGEAYAVSADGSVIVGSSAFIWTPSRGRRPINGVLQRHGIDMTGWTLQEARGISPDGTVIVGKGRNPAGRDEGWIAVIPLEEELAYSLTVNPTQADVGQTVTVAVAVTNFYNTTLTMVHPTGSMATNSNDGGEVIQLTGPVPSEFSQLAPGATNSFAYTFKATKQGQVTFAVGIEATTQDGKTIEGTSKGPPLGRILTVTNSGYAVTAPKADEIVEPETSYTIRFETPTNVTAVNIFLVTNSLSSGGARALLARDVPAAKGTFVWDVPAELLSPSTFVVIANADDPSSEATSSRFRVRLPWYLIRVSGTFQNPEYTPFFPEVNAFSFLPQDESVAWPVSYWQEKLEFYYNNGGQDPFYPAGTEYHPIFFSRRVAHLFEPWMAVVKAFGEPGVYTTLMPWTIGGVQWNQPNPEAGIWWNWRMDQTFGVYDGACYGFSMAMMAAFQNPEQFNAKWLPLGRNSENLAARRVADGPLFDETLEAVHALHLYQNGRLETAEMNLSRGVGPLPLSATTPRDVVARLKSMFERDDRDRDRFIIFESEMLPADPQGKPRIGAHAVVPYAMGFEGEEGSDEGLYTIGIIDPNWGPRTPTDNNPTYLYVDTRTDEWWHEDARWAGDTGKGLFLSMEVIHAFAPASTTWPHVFPGVGAEIPPRDRLSIGIIGTEGAVSGATGELRFAGGIRTETLPGGYIHFPLTGAPSNPEAYHVPAGATYRAEAVPRVDGRAGVRVSGGEVTSTFMQTAATVATRQVVELLPAGLHSVSGGGGTFELTSLLFSETREFHGIRVTGLKTDNPGGLRLVRDSDGFRLTAPSAATIYHLELSRTSSNGLQVFHHVNVPLAAGATHILHPVWTKLDDGPTSLAVDLTGDGVADESILLDNHAPSTAIWTGWDGGEVRLEIETRPGAAAFRVVALANGPLQVETSRDLVAWSRSGVVPANSWLPLASLSGVAPADEGPLFVRIRR